MDKRPDQVNGSVPPKENLFDEGMNVQVLIDGLAIFSAMFLLWLPVNFGTIIVAKTGTDYKREKVTVSSRRGGELEPTPPAIHYFAL
jgi:hypothetical protein